jgi:hypothetical protein
VTSQQPDPIWVPTGRDIAAAGITAFAEQAAAVRGYRGESYLDLWRWSVEHLDDFWAAVWDHFDVRSPTPYRAVRDGAMPSVRWFDGAQVSYVEHLFRDRSDDAVAIVDVAESAAAGLRVRRLTWAQLRAEVAAVAALLQQLGVSRGDRVAAYVPNTAEAVVGFLAAAALGAVWSACGQDYAPGAAAQRLAQQEPIVLIAADGYRYGGATRPPRRWPNCAARCPACGPPWCTTGCTPTRPGPTTSRRGRPRGSANPCARQRCRSNTRCGCCSPREPPAGPRASCTAPAGYCWSTSKPSGWGWTSRARHLFLVHLTELDGVELPGVGPAGRGAHRVLRRQPHPGPGCGVVNHRRHRVTAGNEPGACVRAPAGATGRAHDLSALRSIGSSGAVLPPRPTTRRQHIGARVR